MARRQVLEIVCDRCKKTETQDVQSGDPTKAESDPPKAEVVITFHGETVKYDDLCKSCRKAVGNLFKKIAKTDEPKGSNVTPIEPQKTSEKRRFLGGK